jgi:flagellar hook assembly protein FlgD
VETAAQATPDRVHLVQNYPNPFNPVTTIAYGLPETAMVSLVVYDVTGQEVIRLMQARQSAGWHSLQWNGRDTAGHPVGTGVYFARIRANGFSDVIKMVYLR